MTMNRRSILGTLGKAFGAGGLLLPFKGQSALAMPVDLGPAAKVALKAAPVPISQEGQELRYLRQHLFKLQSGTVENPYGRDGICEFTRLMINEYRPRAKANTGLARRRLRSGPTHRLRIASSSPRSFGITCRRMTTCMTASQAR
jgi:hypothetical protein